jgi:Cu-Zn family superoxide dismutase
VRGVHFRGRVVGRTRVLSCFRFLSNAMSVMFVAGTTLVLNFALGTWVHPTWAQEARRASITVAPLTLAAPSSKTRLSIQIRSLNALAKNSSIRVRGLPDFTALSNGYATGHGTWSLPLTAAPSLTILVPVGIQGKSDIVIELVNDGRVLATAKTVLVIPASPAKDHQHAPSAATTQRDLDPSPLAAIRQGFDEFLARTKASAKSALTTEQKEEQFREFLTWPKNPLEVTVTVRWTSPSGVGEVVGTLAVKNTEIVVAGRKETALLLEPRLRGLRPGFYAFHVHESPNCGPALKDAELVPGLAAGSHLWLSGTGELSGTTFSSHLGNLPNLEVNADGTATKAVVAARLTLADVANRSLMIHASQDDFSPRMACGRLN